MKRRLVFTSIAIVSGLAFGGNSGQAYNGTFNQLAGMVLDASRTGQKVFVEEFTGIN
ncbi:MAG: hypothetical protein GXO90_08585 [FCB group bacterium]|nr:hypothetical protein [FCB group bacterium]